jgi:hypothetical protein
MRTENRVGLGMKSTSPTTRIPKFNDASRAFSVRGGGDDWQSIQIEINEDED